MTTTTITVRDDFEYGEFFVNERSCIRDNGKIQHSATWVAYSSFGVFGHHWSHMGEPFAEFIRDVDSGYLLGKIAKKETSTRKVVAGVRREITAARKDKSVTKDEAREAMDELNELASEYDGSVLCHKVYESPEISKCVSDFCDIDTQEWDCQAVGFVKRLWPKFVAALRERVEAAAREESVA